MSNEAMLGKLGKPGRMIQEELMDGETLITAYGGKNRAWGLTNQRLIDAKAGAFGIGDWRESARLHDVVSIKAGNAWIRVELSNGGEWGLNYGFTGGKQAQEFVRHVRAAQTSASTAAPAPASPASASVADELAKLAQLHDRGVLTDEEFQAQKATLLT